MYICIYIYIYSIYIYMYIYIHKCIYTYMGGVERGASILFSSG